MYNITNIASDGEFRIDRLSYDVCPPERLDVKILNDAELARFNAIIAPRRKCEFYYTRVLWKEVGNDQIITYNQLGMPEVKGTNISISHSGTEIVIGQHRNSRVGVDVELYNEKVLRIADKFLSASETKRFGRTDLTALTAIWSTKESFFKLFCEEHLKFAEQMEVTELQPHPKVKIMHVAGSKSYNFSLIPFDKFVVTYCILSQ